MRSIVVFVLSTYGFLTATALPDLVHAESKWATLRGNVQRTGYVRAKIHPPFQVVWVRHFTNERISSCVEPIVANGKLFIATHSGNVYALNADTGQPLWRFQAHGAFLHSPAFEDGLLISACTDGGLYALDSSSGGVAWSRSFGQGGFSASPTIAEGAIFIGNRSGDFLAVELKSGKILWTQHFGVPIRQTAAFANGKVFITAEDLRVRCLDAQTGEIIWTSQQLAGQTARDYYPVLVTSNKRYVIVRTNPVDKFSDRLASDRHFICQKAGIDDSDWRNLDQWCKDEKALGNQELWDKEQSAIIQYLKEDPFAQTFFLIDADTGGVSMTAPMLWAGGCQGVGTPPVPIGNNQLLVLYRTVYGNWNLGVAPFVGLGILDLNQNRITPLRHVHGMQPPWNTFWGTADESQNFVVTDKFVIIVHQSTLSGFDINTHELFTIAGDRDGWGGFRNLPWARNEWNGPSRGGVAIVDKYIYWQTGSRILCIASGRQGEPAKDIAIDGNSIKTTTVTNQRAAIITKLDLDALVSELLSDRWAPLLVEPGLAGREFHFDNSGDFFEALAWAYPHLSEELKERVKSFLRKEWANYPPFTEASQYQLDIGRRREFFRVQTRNLNRPWDYKGYHPFGNTYSIFLFAQRCGEWDLVLSEYQHLKASFEDFIKSNWQLDPNRGELFANRYLSSLIALRKIAEKIGDTESSEKAKKAIERITDLVVKWWENSAKALILPVFKDIAEWDNFIGNGDSLFFSIHPHKAKIALFHKMTPEVAQILKSRASEAVNKVWNNFELLCPTWHLMGEERQVHYGENYIDPPDFALDAFCSKAWLFNTQAEELLKRLDIPFCRADIYYIIKASIISDLE